MSVRRFFEFLHGQRILVQTAFVVIVTAMYVWLVRDEPVYVHNFENYMIGLRLQTRPARPPPQDIVIISVDNGSFLVNPTSEVLKDHPERALTPEQLKNAPELAFMTQKWPWDRQIWGELTARLLGVGARMVAFDFVFHDPLVAGDKETGLVFQKYARQVVIASKLGGSDVGSNDVVARPADNLVPSDDMDIVGLNNINEDSDGLVHQIHHKYLPLRNMEAELNPTKSPKAPKEFDYSFSWMIARKLLGVSPDTDPDKPMSADTVQMMLNYYGPAGTIKTFTLQDVLLNWDTLIFQHGEYFKNKIVLVGPQDDWRFKGNYYNTPLDWMFGVEIQATAVANMLQGDWLTPAPDLMVLVLALSLGMLVLMVSIFVRAVMVKMGLFLTLGAIFLEATQHLFWSYQIVTPVAGAAMILIGCGVFGTMYDYVLEKYERQRMLGVFESMVSPGVAGLVLSHRGDFEKRLGGQRQEVVVLFADIRGFTSWSEKSSPDEVVSQLNEYFTAIVDVVQNEGGTVQKYIGDAVMAAWGDVREQPPLEGAKQAVRAALRMQQAVRKLNEGWKGNPARQQLFFGVGINHGDSAIVGQIGHPRRMEFTVMGDTVNFASRLESATKQYHQDILVGETVYEMTKPFFLYRYVDKIQVYGKTKSVSVYLPIGDRADAPPPGLSEYEQALKKYLSRDFRGAAELFRSANEKMGGADFLCRTYLFRCEHYQQTPPPPEWDGTWVLKEK